MPCSYNHLPIKNRLTFGTGQLAVTRYDTPGDIAGLAGADFAVIKFGHRYDFSGGAGQERLIGGIDVQQRHVALDTGDTELLRDIDNRIARDAFQNAG